MRVHRLSLGMMALFWSRVADFTQRGIAVVLFSMTVVGTVILAQGGYGVVRRHRERKALEKSGETTAVVSGANVLLS